MGRPRGERFGQRALTGVRVSYDIRDRLMSMRQPSEQTFNDVIRRLLEIYESAISEPDIGSRSLELVDKNKPGIITHDTLKQPIIDKLLTGTAKDVYRKTSTTESKHVPNRQRPRSRSRNAFKSVYNF
ncbi:MAG TPA: hypothetical protein VFJ05_07055 [Nitrososphaeraceae archaeon]|nr:hypothetical protein [Nitrososphaeraceae archaeon]